MPEKCKAEVMQGFHFYRCYRNAWKDGFCKQHHPETKEKRRQESQKKWEEKQASSPWTLLEKANARIKELEQELSKLRDAMHPCNGCIWLGKSNIGELGCILKKIKVDSRCEKYSTK